MLEIEAQANKCKLGCSCGDQSYIQKLNWDVAKCDTKCQGSLRRNGLESSDPFFCVPGARQGIFYTMLCNRLGQGHCFVVLLMYELESLSGHC